MSSNEPARDYVRQLGAAMVAYVIVLAGSVLLLRANPETPAAIPLALAPVVPAMFAILALSRFVSRMDELQRRIQFDGLALSAGMTAGLTFSYGFLEGVGFPRLSWIWILPMMVAFWGIGVAFAARRYQ